MRSLADQSCQPALCEWARRLRSPRVKRHRKSSMSLLSAVDLWMIRLVVVAEQTTVASGLTFVLLVFQIVEAHPVPGP